MKMKEFGPRGGGRVPGAPPLDPPMASIPFAPPSPRDILSPSGFLRRERWNLILPSHIIVIVDRQREMEKDTIKTHCKKNPRKKLRRNPFDDLLPDQCKDVFKAFGWENIKYCGCFGKFHNLLSIAQSRFLREEHSH